MGICPVACLKSLACSAAAGNQSRHERLASSQWLVAYVSMIGMITLDVRAAIKALRDAHLTTAATSCIIPLAFLGDCAYG